jgi:TetR/AcrR family transcriptional regulator
MKKNVRDSVATRKKILTHATAEFTAKGFDGARVDSIAKRCKLSKNMLYHYYGSKEGLFIAVLEAMYERFRERQKGFEIGGVDPLESMRQLVAQTFSALLEQREVIALLNSENLHKGRHVQRSSRIREIYNPLVDSIREILRSGAERGQFRDDIDPVTLYMSLSSLAYHYISNQYTFKAAFGIDFTTEERRAAWLRHITDMVMAYCQTGDRQKNITPANKVA